MKTCAQCGAEFPDSIYNRQKRFCRKSCGQLWHKAKARKAKPEKLDEPFKAPIYRNLTSKPLVLHIAAAPIPPQPLAFAWLYR